jgi:transposase
MGLVHKFTTKKKYDLLNKELLEDLYFNKNMNYSQIARHLDISKNKVARHMRIHEIAGRRRTNSLNINRASLDFETILKRYNDGETQAQIAKDYGFTPTTIWLYLKEHGVKSRKRGRSGQDLDKIINLEKVKQMRSRGLSLKVISKFFKVPESTIYVYVQKHNIPTKKSPTLKKGKVEEIKRLYQSGLSMQQLAEKYKVSPSSIVLFFKKYNIPSRNPKKRFDFTKEQLEIVQGLLDQGFSCLKISKKMQVPYLKLIKLVSKKEKKNERSRV